VVAIKEERTRLATGSLVILAALAIAVALHYTQTVMIPFVLAVFIATLTSPLLDALVLKCRFPRSIALIVSLLVLAAVMGVICLLVAQAIQMILATTSRYSQDFTNFVSQMLERFKDWGIELDQQEIVGALSQKVPQIVTSTFGTVFGFLSSVMLTAIFAAFLLAGRDPRVIHQGVFAEIDGNIRRYIATKVVLSIITGVSVWVLLAMFGLELAAVFGMLAFLLNFIPNIGSIIATLLPLPVAIVQFESPLTITLAVLLPGAVQMTVGNVIEPKMLGKGLNLHAVTVLLALSFWGLIWGVVGMFLAAPLTAILRIICLQFKALRPIGKLMGGEMPGSAAAPNGAKAPT